jgi:hypothetical protein
MKKKIDPKQLEQDLQSYCFRIRYRDDLKNKRELYFWIPCPTMGCCHSIKLILKEDQPALLVKAEELTQPDGPGTEEFAARAGVWGMTCPEDFGLVVREYIILLTDLLELRIQPSFFAHKIIVYRRKKNGKFIRRKLRGQC